MVFGGEEIVFEGDKEVVILGIGTLWLLETIRNCRMRQFGIVA